MTDTTKSQLCLPFIIAKITEPNSVSLSAEPASVRQPSRHSAKVPAGREQEQGSGAEEARDRAQDRGEDREGERRGQEEEAGALPRAGKAEAGAHNFAGRSS